MKSMSCKGWIERLLIWAGIIDPAADEKIEAWSLDLTFGYLDRRDRDGGMDDAR